MHGWLEGHADDGISVAELRNRLWFNTMREHLKNRIYKVMEQSSWFIKCRKFEVFGSLARWRPGKYRVK